ncbi:MAG: PhoU domain-containing protein [Candidatus Bathyarchaeia archaeon]
MEIRKVQESAGSLYLSVPKGWARRNKVSKGTRIYVVERGDGSLILSPGYRPERPPETATVRFSPQLEIEITSKYWLGYDSVIVESQGRLTLEDIERVKAVTRRLVGLEIVEQNARTVHLQCLLEPSAFPPEKILRREYLLSASMERDLGTALVERDRHLAETVIERDEEVDRLYFLLVRILRTLIQHPALSEELKFSPINCLDYRLVAGFVESIADQVVTATKHLLPRLGALPEALAYELNDFLTAAYKVNEDAVYAFLSNDFKQASSAREQRRSLQEKLREAEPRVVKLPFEDYLYVSAVLSALERIIDYSVDIADMIIPS